MLFGRGNSKPEDIRVDGIMPMVEKLLEKRISGLELQASRTVRDIEKARNSFLDACITFESLQSEPDTENIYVTKTSYLKDMKTSYTTALKRIINTEKEYEASGNVYEKYNSELSHIEGQINEILKANRTFRPVLETYSSYLDRFKLTFTNLERAASELRTELNFYQGDFSRYNTISSKTEELMAAQEEIESLKSELSEIASAPTTTQKDESMKETLESEIKEKQKKLNVIYTGSFTTSATTSPVTIFSVIAAQGPPTNQLSADPLPPFLPAGYAPIQEGSWTVSTPGNVITYDFATQYYLPGNDFGVARQPFPAQLATLNNNNVAGSPPYNSVFMYAYTIVYVPSGGTTYTFNGVRDDGLTFFVKAANSLGPWTTTTYSGWNIMAATAFSYTCNCGPANTRLVAIAVAWENAHVEGIQAVNIIT